MSALHPALLHELSRARVPVSAPSLKHITTDKRAHKHKSTMYMHANMQMHTRNAQWEKQHTGFTFLRRASFDIGFSFSRPKTYLQLMSATTTIDDERYNCGHRAYRLVTAIDFLKIFLALFFEFVHRHPPAKSSRDIEEHGVVALALLLRF